MLMKFDIVHTFFLSNNFMILDNFNSNAKIIHKTNNLCLSRAILSVVPAKKLSVRLHV